MKKVILALVALGVIPPPGALLASTITSNLLTNSGAEAGSLAGWTSAGPGNPTVDSGSYDPGINPLSGNYDFVGYDAASDSLSQTVSLITQGITVGLIESGMVSADLSFWEQGLNQGSVSDDAAVTLTFLNGSGTAIGSVQSPFIDSHNLAWENYSNTYIVPTGSRSIEYTMDFHRNVGSALDAFVDDNSLTLTTPDAPSPVPEPSSLALLGSGAIGLAAVARRRLSRL